MSNPGPRPPITNADRGKFPVAGSVGYTPGYGTYGYEDCVGKDGRVPAIVLGYTRTRIRIKFTEGRLRNVTRAVDPASLSRTP